MEDNRAKLIDKLRNVYRNLTPSAIGRADLDGMAFTVDATIAALSAIPASPKGDLGQVVHENGPVVVDWYGETLAWRPLDHGTWTPLAATPAESVGEGREAMVEAASRYVLDNSRRSNASMNDDQRGADTAALMKAYRNIIGKAIDSGFLALSTVGVEIDREAVCQQCDPPGSGKECRGGPCHTCGGTGKVAALSTAGVGIDREALEPFARLAGPINGEQGRPTYLEAISGPNGTNELQLSTYVGDGKRIEIMDAEDFRRARAALQPEPAK